MYIRPEDRKNRIAISFFHLISQVSRRLSQGSQTYYMGVISIINILHQTIQAALAENCMRMNFCGLKDNKPAVELFQSLGADNLTLKEGWHYYRIPRHGIEELAQPSIITKFNP